MARKVNPEFIIVAAPGQGELLDRVKVGAWPFGTTPNSHPDGPVAVVSVVPTERAGDTCKVPMAELLARLPDGGEYEVWLQGDNEGIVGQWVKDADDTIVSAAVPNITSVDLQ